MATRHRFFISMFIAAVALNNLACGAPAETGADAAKRWTPQSGREPKAGDEWINPKDGSVMIFIAGGEFMMGSDKGDDDEKPVHKVAVKSFWLGKYEVTNRQFAPFYDLGEVPEPIHWAEKGYDDPQQPIAGLIWESVTSYCQWAGVRLPTEAEWEFAAAGGKQLEYPTATGAISHDLANFRGVAGKDKWEGPAPVGQFPPNPFGLFDMAGNAWEWTSTIYEPYPSVTDGSRENFDPDNRHMQVMRGGSWGFSEAYCRTAFRKRFASHLAYDWVGFRVACDADYPKKAASGAAK